MSSSRSLTIVAIGASIFPATVAFGDGLPNPTRHPLVTGIVAAPASMEPRSALEVVAPGVMFSEQAGRVTRVYGVTFGSGKSPVESANRFVASHSDIFGVPSGDLAPIGPYDDGHHMQPVKWDAETESYQFTLLAFTQQVAGIPVFRSQLKLLVRNEPGFPLVLAAADLRDLGVFRDTVQGKALSPSRLDSAVYAKDALSQYTDAPEVTAPQLVIFAGTDDGSVPPRLAVSFVIERGTPGVDLQKFLYVADAATGEVLFEEDQICYNVTGTASGMATYGPSADACGTEVSTALPYIQVTGPNGTVFANSLGQFDVPATGTGTVDLSAGVNGQFFVTANQSGSNESLATSAPGNGTASFLFNAANTSEQSRAAVNAYLHANVVRDYTLVHNPSYPTIATQTGFPCNVNIASTCNAFYDGVSLNFYSAGGGCNNTAFSTVVHHEYGHHLVAVAGSGQGAYGEGFGDIMGMLCTDTSPTGIGFQSCTSGIRDANNTCQYNATGCSSCGSEIHACGQLISGCAWSVRQYLLGAGYPNFREILGSLAVNSMLLHTGTTINSDITIDWLTLDDNNGNISDGTPHYASINQGFSAHGLPGPAISPVAFSFAGGLPSMISPHGTSSISVSVSALAATPIAGTGKFYWRTGTTGSFNLINMSQTSNNNYTVTVPATACPSTMQYYFTAGSTGGTVANPLGAPTTVYSATVATELVAVANDTCETSTGWVVGASGDTATTGIWENVDPVATSAQPGDDHTANGVNCWITGQHVSGGAGSADIDGGTTTLMSPVYNLASSSGATISFWMWYSNNAGSGAASDTMPIEITNNNGSTWVALETIPVDGSTNAWVQKSYRVSDFVTPTAQVRFRVRAQDLGTGSLVEAGIDDVQVVAFGCGAPPIIGDLNSDGVVNGVDLAILLGAWGTPGGDVDGNGDTDGADLAAQVANWS